MVEENIALKENVVWLDKNQIVHSVYHGEQTREKLSLLIAETDQICKDLIAHDRPVLLLSDIRDMGEHRPEARIVGMRARAQLPFWRLAIVTSKIKNSNEAISRKLTAMSSRKKEIAYFTSLPDAYRWLNELAEKSDYHAV